MRAYKLQEESARYPRIIITNDVTNIGAVGGAVLVGDDGFHFLDPLSETYIRGIETHGGLEDALRHIRAHIVSNLGKHSVETGPYSHWFWYARQFNRKLRTLAITNPGHIEL